MKSLLMFLLISMMGATFVGCGGGKTVVVQHKGGERPEWTYKAGGAFTVEGRKVFRSVGISSDLGNEAMTFNASANDARKNLSFIMKTYVKALDESYKRSIKTGEMPKAQFEQDITHVSEVMTKSKFSGAQIVNRWIDPKNNSVYTLLELDLNGVNEMIKQAKGISQQLIDTVGKRSEEAHKRMGEKMKELGDF